MAGKKVLVVDDDVKTVELVKLYLNRDGYKVLVAYDGNEALRLAHENHPDIIVLDLMLPGMDGLSICRNLRKETNHTPILILTAKGELSDKVEGLNSGADDYLVKPFAFAELLARVKALSRRPKDSLNSKLAAADLTLDALTYEVKRGGKKVDLSKKEFALLEYLLRHKGKVVAKDQIIQSVWDYEADILPNTVEVFIGYLRNKIDRVFPEKPSLIQTIRGFGYKID